MWTILKTLKITEEHIFTIAILILILQDKNSKNLKGKINKFILIIR